MDMLDSRCIYTYLTNYYCANSLFGWNYEYCPEKKTCKTFHTLTKDHLKKKCIKKCINFALKKVQILYSHRKKKCKTSYTKSWQNLY